jgi:hypothetical protein
MPDGSRWAVPAKVVADACIAYYAAEGQPFHADDAAKVRTDRRAIEDWGKNDMNWDDVAAHAARLPDEPTAVDYQEGWVNGEWEFVDTEEAA